MTDNRDLLGELIEQPLGKKEKGLTRVFKRLITPSDEETEICFQHSVICQTGLPYRDPGNAIRKWQRDQGKASLLLVAGEIMNPETGEWVETGLPWGAKARLILAHVNGEALRQRSRFIEIESSLTGFVKRIRGFESGGREIKAFKQQLTRLTASTMRLAIRDGERVHQKTVPIITEFDVWFQKDERQRVLWSNNITLSDEYFTSLQKHAVPLNESDLGALAHSAMALDIYSWLAQRLHRIPGNEPARISWAALKAQFGPDYGRMEDFRKEFKKALKQVKIRYYRANIEIDSQGMIASASPPPVGKRFNIISA